MTERKRGRPTILSEAIIAAVCASLEEGAHFDTSCEAAGVSVNTAKEWLRRGDAGEQPFEAFSTAVTCARARGELFLHRKVCDGGRGSQGAQFLLERRFRDHYGNVQRIEHAGHDGGPVQITAKAVTEMSDEELLRLANPTGSDSGTGAARVIEASGAVLDGIVLPADGHGLQVGQAHALGGGAPGGTGAERDSETRDLHAAASQQELPREREIPGLVPGTESAE